eukprot:scaffold120659_cov51-Phaeocystis_antarctica.AAC.2
MSVTLEVSQLDMSALNWFKFRKRLDMSVTAETPQLEMGPYVAVAGGGEGGGGCGAASGGKGGDGGEPGGGGGGGGAGEHAPKPLQAEPYRLTNSALSAHAQRVRTLFASDNAFAPCRVQREASEEGRHASWQVGGRGAAAAQAACREDSTVKACWQGHAQSAR